MVFSANLFNRTPPAARTATKTITRRRKRTPIRMPTIKNLLS